MVYCHSPMKLRRYMAKMGVYGFLVVLFFMWLCANGVRTKNLATVEEDAEEKNSDGFARWICSNNTCSRARKPYNDSITMVSLETCRRTCTDNVIWPRPKHFKLISEKSHSTFLKSNLQFNVEALPKTTRIINMFIDIFKGYLKDNGTGTDKNIVKINIKVSNKIDDVVLNLGTDESYELVVKKGPSISVTIISSTFYGARHALESLSQLVWYDPQSKLHRILHDIEVKDSPSFTYRGIMVDTARNFFPIPLLKKVVDGMSYSKLNTLHLHLTDAVSFPMILKNLEWLADGAYDPKMTYTEEDIEGLRLYSEIRGVRVILEIDAPSHVSAGWQSHPKSKDLVICDEDDVNNGHLNPDNPKSLEVLKDIYKNLLGLMRNDDVFHIGGDEVNLDCWENTEAAVNETDMTIFWARYTNSMIKQLTLANDDKLPKNIIMWSSPLTNYRYTLSELKHRDHLIVQFWFGQPSAILDLGIRIIYSTVGHWYLDCGFGPWKPSQQNGVCDPYTSWQKFYEYKPWESSYARNLTEGGEVCLWAEQVAEESLETRIWPRTAAFAERVWGDPSVFEDDVYVRLDNFREVLRFRGLKVSAIWPKWCTLNPGKCK